MRVVLALTERATSALTSALLVGALAGSLTALAPSPALAIGRGDMEIGVAIKSYEEAACPEELRQGRAGGALGAGAGGGGISQKCVLVKASAVNNGKEAAIDAGIFGLVSGKADGMSVLGNGQDGKNDSGQFAMVPKIPVGTSDIEFLFVAQQGDDCVPTRKEPCPVQVWARPSFPPARQCA